MTLKTDRAKATQEEADRVINAGGSVPNREEKVDSKDNNLVKKSDIRFTVTMPYEMADAIDRLRKPTKTSRQAWLMQVAQKHLEEIKRNGL